MSGEVRIPLWLAVAITVVVSVPFGTLIGAYNVALWASFIAWAEYFAFGATPDQLKWIYGLFPLGALTMAFFASFNNWFLEMGLSPLESAILWLFIWVCIAVYVLEKYITRGLEKGLAFFNGLSMFLALYFAGVGPGFGGGPLIGSPEGLAWLVNPWIQWLWVSLAGVFGGFLGWFNVAITFPKGGGSEDPPQEPAHKKPWGAAAIVCMFVFSLVVYLLFRIPGVLSGTTEQFVTVVSILWALILAVGITAIRKA